MRVQIAGISNLKDALAVVEFGGDGIGFTLGLPGGPHDGLTEKKARDIIVKLPPLVSTVLITYHNTAEKVGELARYLGVTTVQLHNETDISEMKKIREIIPHIKLIKSVNVIDEPSIEKARELSEHVDCIILDTYDPETGRHGATGKTHNWDISRRIVEECKVPVILAGGLNPDNVEEAIKKVEPWGVDVHTGIENEDGTKNYEKMRLFIERAKRITNLNNRYKL
ncbi:MAG: phosphoribosylanthranilate isomerase [Candidatus Aenigmatarchaeota archaeon]